MEILAELGLKDKKDNGSQHVIYEIFQFALGYNEYFLMGKKVQFGISSVLRLTANIWPQP